MSEVNLPIALDGLKGYLEERLDERLLDIKKEIKESLGDEDLKLIWMTVDRDDFRDAVKVISEIQKPHLSVASGSDKGDHIELIYHFQVNYSYPGKETAVNLKVHLPKDDPTLPTITDIIPGAIMTEREKQEMLGVDIIDIPDSRRMWLGDEYPEDKYPWRWDDEGMEDISHHPHDAEEAPKEPTAHNPRKRGEE
uniref:Membrane-bound hydrogenase MBH 2, subunit Mbh2K (Hydrogenase subunit) n=1 Tax=uncultured organism TaxID=155900 RepID=M1PV55_9ZZZZ|nr:membrane-bound hydrogenase MBH 2, subunit Mbh2K (hydrogenase subunit) [uncultured organism]